MSEGGGGRMSEPKLVSWYVALWRCIWAIPAYWLGLALFVVVAIGWGFKAARQVVSELLP